MSPLPTGTYKLINVAVNLPLKPAGSTSKSAVIVATDDRSDSFNWVLTHVSGSKYTITNVKNQMFAFLGYVEEPPAKVFMSTVHQEFIISPVQGSPGVYTIASVNTGVFWSLDSSNAGSYVNIASTDTASLQHFKIAEQYKGRESYTHVDPQFTTCSFPTNPNQLKKWQPDFP